MQLPTELLLSMIGVSILGLTSKKFKAFEYSVHLFFTLAICTSYDPDF